MDLNLKDKVFLVTGGGSGIGASIVRLAAGEGAKVAIVGKTIEKINALSEELNAAGCTTLPVQTELTDPEQCKNAVATTVKELGDIYCLVNNAGTNDGIGLESGDPAGFMNSIKINLWHYYTMAHYALPSLKKTKGNIVNVSSKTAITGQGGTSGYAAANGGQNSLTREWAVELIDYGIRVNAIIPAEVKTPQYARWINSFPNGDEKLQEICNRIPFEKRMTSSEEIADSAVFLASGRASHITGQLLYVDGGYVHLDRAIGTLNK